MTSPHNYSKAEVDELKARLAEIESARAVQDAALACLRNDLRECARDRDRIQAELLRATDKAAVST